MNEISEILDYFPYNIKSCVLNSGLDVLNISEIRLRKNKPVSLTINNENHILYEKVDEKTISSIFDRVVNFSIHTHQREINNGFVTLKNGMKNSVVILPVRVIAARYKAITATSISVFWRTVRP